MFSLDRIIKMFQRFLFVVHKFKVFILIQYIKKRNVISEMILVFTLLYSQAFKFDITSLKGSRSRT